MAKAGQIGMSFGGSGPIYLFTVNNWQFSLATTLKFFETVTFDASGKVVTLLGNTWDFTGAGSVTMPTPTFAKSAVTIEFGDSRYSRLAAANTFTKANSFNGAVTLGDAVGDAVTNKAGTHTYPNATTINYDAATTLDATGQTVGHKGTWDYSGATLIVPTYTVDVHIVVSAFSKGKGTNPPAEETIGPWDAFDFDKNGDDELFGIWEIPENYSNGTDITVSFRWAPTDTGTKTVTWGLEHEVRRPENGEALNAGTTTQIVTDDGLGQANGYQESGDITISGAGIVRSDTLGMRVFRDADASESGADDDYDNDAALIELHLSYTADKL
jgi:hypothetical protein